MSDQDKPFSFAAFVKFITGNGKLLSIVALFFLGGFFFGSAWTGKQKSTSSETVALQDDQAGQNAQSGIVDFSTPGLIALAESQGADATELNTCLSDPSIAQRVETMSSDAEEIGIGGTPSTVIVVNDIPVQLVVGALPADQLQDIIDGYISGETTVSADPTLGEFVPVSESDHRRGAESAQVVLVEYSDYQCPFCKQFHPTLETIVSNSEDRVAWVYRHYPLLNHPQAQPAAVVAECVAQTAGNEAFWSYTDTLLGS